MSTYGGLNPLQGFRDPRHVHALARAVQEQAQLFRNQHQHAPRIMEVCGGHTHAIYRYGLQQLVGDSVEFLHGPGCPVCVLPRARIDTAIALAQQADVILATFGDVMRVPGTRQNFFQAKAAGADIRVVYSALDALRLAQRHPDKRVIFFAIGFETTMPGTALTLQQAQRDNVTNFFVLCHHILIMPALHALLQDKDCMIDGFIGPGHVSAIIGSRVYEPVCRDYGRPLVIAGFEPVDILQSLLMVLQQLNAGRAAIEIQYNRVVQLDGNPRAQAVLQDAFRIAPGQQWRGLGWLDHSGVTLQPAYARFDAEPQADHETDTTDDNSPLQCDQVLKGRLKPAQCEFFGNRCTPQQPLGALMVSSEGACAACFQHA